MGDFLLDLRAVPQRNLARVAESLRFMEHSRAEIFSTPEFGLVVTYTEDPSLWAPFLGSDGTLVAVAGRVALEEHEWAQGESVPGKGGLAAKAILQKFRKHGVAALNRLSGNAAVLLFDPSARELHVVADCVGVFPIYEWDGNPNLILGSHPDVVAEAAGELDNLDETSLAEFAFSSTVSPPFTYYRRVRFAEQSSRTTFRWPDAGVPVMHREPIISLAFHGDSSASEEDLAEQLASAFRSAIRRRTLKRLGTTAVALSGGLDSRVILSCIDDRQSAFAFTCYDEPNRELNTAANIAKAAGVRFGAWQRPFDYYGDNASLGVRISGGMGSFANNHFLGIVPRLRAEGAQNLLTGCYCDYLFKGLPLNRKRHWLTGQESLAPFRHQFYFSHKIPDSTFAPAVRARWESRIPVGLQDQTSAEKVFQIEARRTFPLCYEGDNQQRVVPQRVTGWFLPMADQEIVDVYQRIPYTQKLNRSIFLKMVRILCDPAISAIADANTGAKPGAGILWEVLSEQRLRITRKLRRFRPSIGTDGSWPDWWYYVGKSKKLAELWERPNPAAMDLLRRIVGSQNVRPTVADYLGHDVFLLVSLLTIKLWMDRRLA